MHQENAAFKIILTDFRKYITNCLIFSTELHGVYRYDAGDVTYFSDNFRMFCAKQKGLTWLEFELSAAKTPA